MAALVIFHVQGPTNVSIAGALISATSPFGPWQGLTDCAGNFIAQLTPGHYDLTVSAPGCKTRTLPAEIADAGIITIGLDTSFSPAPRTYRGQMCGSHVAGLPPVPGGAADSSLVLSWFIDRYQPSDRQRIYAQWHAEGVVDVLVSWPDSQAFGQSPQQFVGTCHELITNGFIPCPFMCAKPTSSDNVMSERDTLANIMLVLPLLVGVVSRLCIGWELSLFLTPTDVQMLIDAICPIIVPSGCKVYVHFQEDYFSFPQPGQDNASFWKLQIGKLTGVLHQRRLSNDMALYQSRLVDCLQRAAGGFGMPDDSGFGHPFDVIALEITAQLQFNGQMDETTGNQWGALALSTPTQYGPTGKSAYVMGSGNGQ